MNRVIFVSLYITFFVLIGHVFGQTQERVAPYILILGVAQDAGYPQAGCYKPHCMRAWKDPSLSRSATSFALIDPVSKKKWVFEATPDIKKQLYTLQTHAPDSEYELAGIFLTHAHIGHYTGLMHFGREAIGSRNMKVYAMPKMMEFLSQNGPWSQLVDLQNIKIQPLQNNSSITLSPSISVKPFLVPHRDEFSETVGYEIKSNDKTVIFIPDIDKWQKWDTDISQVVQSCDIALLDATFFDGDELPGRNMTEIPHPFVEESLKTFNALDLTQKNKIHFIHFNHTNPLLIDNSTQHNSVIEAGYNVAKEGQVLSLE